MRDLVHKKQQLPRETTISQVLLPLLEQYPSIDIAGIGNLGFRQIPASLDHETHELFPPMRSLAFTPELSGERELFDVLPGELGKKQTKQLRSQVDYAINELINLGKTMIDGLATIQRQEDGQFTLTHIDPSIGGYQQYLPIVTLRPLATPHTAWLDKSSVAVGTPLITPASTTVSTPSIKEDKPGWYAYLWPAFFLCCALAIIGMVMKQCEHRPRDRSDQSGAVGALGQDASASVAAIDTTKQIFASDQLSKYKDILTQEIIEAGCTIVVGSFSDRDRAVSMSSQARSMGYEVDDVRTVKPFRVVIRFDCAEYDLDEYLDEVRSKFDPKAWYLSPDYKGGE